MVELIRCDVRLDVRVDKIEKISRLGNWVQDHADCLDKKSVGTPAGL